MAEPTALISSLQHFSVGDGPGIRSTVFFQGCNLRCPWCHNPETISLRPVLLFDPSRCTDCGLCVRVCPSGAQALREGHAGGEFPPGTPPTRSRASASRSPTRLPGGSRSTWPKTSIASPPAVSLPVTSRARHAGEIDSGTTSTRDLVDPGTASSRRESSHRTVVTARVGCSAPPSGTV